MKKIFIAATKQNDGKTTVSLGLIFHFKQRCKNVGFIKPIGQRYLEEEGVKIDEDSILIEEVCGIKLGLKDMSPVAVEKGFTERYIAKPDPKAITAKIRAAYQRISRGQEMVVIEGTGHAGVGSVFDHSNASVARVLGSKVIIISSGGVGRPIDEILLNKALFDKEGVKVLGVIVNKVLPSKFERINQYVRKGLERKGVRVLGVLPYDPLLAKFSLKQVLAETDFELLSGGEFIGNYVMQVVIGAMQPRDAVPFIVDDSLLITPGDREDMIAVALDSRRDDGSPRIAGMILSGGQTPGETVRKALAEARIPVLLAKEDTYTVAATIHDLTVKIQPRDTDKIERIIKLAKEHIDFNAILKGM